MKARLYRLYANPKYAKVFYWGKLVSVTGGGQAIIQLIGLFCGILIIRLLTTKEYALYTLVNTMLGTLTLLADAGTTTGVFSQGGKVWEDREKLGVIVVTGLSLRKRFALVVLIIGLPVLLYLLLHHGASLLMATLIILSLIPAFFAGLSDSVLEIGPKLKQDIVLLQKNAFAASVGRLAFTGIFVFIFPFASVAILAGGLPRLWANINLRKFSSVYVDFTQRPSAKIQKEMLTTVKRLLPEMIYYCASGQITIWLISIFGTTNLIAQLGALGRLAMLLSFFSVLFNTLIIPRYARLTENPKELLSRYLQIHIGLLIFCVCVIITVWMFPTPILWILGSSYSQLKNELLLNMMGSCIVLISGLSFSLCLSRSWIINPLLVIPVNIVSIIIGIIIFDVSSLHGILMFNIFLALTQAFLNGAYGFLKIKKAIKSAAIS